LIASLLKGALAVAIGVPLGIYLLQDRLLFHPQRLDDARRAEVKKRFPGVEDAFLDADGAKLHAWRLKGPEGAPLILYFGGNAEEVSWMIEESANLPGVSWLLVDYRGYGLSEGSPGETELVADALRWFDKIAPDAKRIVAFGRSLGSGVAVQLAAARPVQSLILVTPYDSIAAVAKRYYAYVPVDLLLKHRFDSLARASALKQPLLCLIAERDEVIPAEHAERLYAAWAGEKQKVVLRGAGHNSTDADPAFWPAVRKFLEIS
jgi:uncharacterized protein